MASCAADGGNQKKTRTERICSSPSRVLHLCCVPNSITKAEVISLGLPFGKVTNILLLKGKNQALLEMESEEAATKMVKHYTSNKPFLRNKPVYIQYSTYKQLEIRTLPQHQDARRPVKSGRFAATGSPAGVFHRRRSPVLRIIVENAFYPITIEMLHQIFSKFGPVLKIIIFNKHNKFQVLLEYATPKNAYCAKMALNGQNLFNTCCFLRIDFSKLHILKIKYNNDKSRDFTRFNLPSGDVTESSMTPVFGTPNNIISPYAGAVGLFQSMGFPQGPAIPVPMVPGVFNSVPLATAAVPGPMAVRSIAGTPETCVLLVRSFNFEAMKIRGLFILFGVYGNVLRVKIILKEKETALVQMMDAGQAHFAITHLNGQRIYGQVLQVSFSEYQTIQYPAVGQDDQELLEDYSNSPLHRFKKAGYKYYRNLFPPCDTLYLRSIPPSATADDLKELFAKTGSTVKAFKSLKFQCALIQMGSVEEAIQALIELHNHDFGGNYCLQISFSKVTI